MLKLLSSEILGVARLSDHCIFGRRIQAQCVKSSFHQSYVINERLREQIPKGGCVSKKFHGEIKPEKSRSVLGVKQQKLIKDIRAEVTKSTQEWKERIEEETTRRYGVKENAFTIPNALCVLRIGMTPVIAHLVIHNQYAPAIGLLTVAGITDLLDGWIARVVPGQSTVMGSFLDPLADKILVGTLFLSLTYVNLIPVPLTALIVGRDVILIAAGFYIRYQSLDPPRTLSRYFNVTMPTAQLAPAFISKVNTGLQLTLIGTTLLSTVVSSIDLHPYLQVLWYTTATTTIASAVWYCFAKDTVKLLKETSTKIKMRNNQK